MLSPSPPPIFQPKLGVGPAIICADYEAVTFEAVESSKISYSNYMYSWGTLFRGKF